MLLKER